MRPSFLSDTACERVAGRLNIRTKLLVCFCSSLAVIALSNAAALGLLAAVSTVYALTALSVPTLLRTYFFVALMMAVSLAFVALNSLLIPGLIKWEVARFTVPYLRMTVSINTVLALAFSSRIQDVMREIKAFGRFRWIQIPLTVAIRFLPTFIDDCSQVMDAYRLRGAMGKKSVFSRITSFWRAFLVPLTFRLLRSADDLAVAAELKGVGEGKSVRSGRPMTRLDAMALSTAVAALAAAAYIQHVHGATTFAR